MNLAPDIGALHVNYSSPVGYLVRPSTSIFVDRGNLKENYKRTEALRQLRVVQARRSFQHFVEYCIQDDETGQPLKVQWYQDEWIKAMDTEKRLLIIAPRFHGKTTIVVSRVVWELGRNPNLRIKVVCSSDGRAKDRLFEITQAIEDNERVKEVFPHLVPADKGSWTKHQIVVKRSSFSRDASVEALGITSSATGGRADIVIADDVVDRRNALTMPALRTSIKQAWKSDWTQLLSPHGRIWYICTLWHNFDLSHELMENPEYKVIFYAIDNNFGAMWPALWSEQELRRRYNELGPIEFNRAFRNIAQDESLAPIKPHWLKFIPLSEFPPMEELTFITSYDTAKGLKEQNDYTAEVVIGVHRETGTIYVVDASHARVTLAEQDQWVFNSAARYKPYRILIEDVGLSGLYSWVIDRHPELDGITEAINPREGKYQRLVGVTPFMSRGEVTFSSRLDPHGEDYVPGRGDLISELTDFPIAQHDDLCDAFSQAIEGARRYLLDRWATARQDKPKAAVTVIGGDEKKVQQPAQDVEDGEGEIYYTSLGRPKRRPPSKN